MTPRTIESKFSQELLIESKKRLSRDLTLDGSILEKKHPKVLWAQLQLQESPEAELEKPQIKEWHYDCFKSWEDVQKNYPELPESTLGHPYQIFSLVNNSHTAVIHFPSMGFAVIGKGPLKNKGNQQTLPYFLQYALSEEMWGEEGKWTRFHERLLKLFEAKNVLKKEPLPGYYLLDQKIQKTLEEAGYQGTNLERDYLIVLPWTFSLTDLENFEKIIREL